VVVEIALSVTPPAIAAVPVMTSTVAATAGLDIDIGVSPSNNVRRA